MAKSPDAQPCPRPAAERASENVVEDISTQRRLRRELRLGDREIAEIDLELAVEAGLLPKPKGRPRG